MTAKNQISSKYNRAAIFLNGEIKSPAYYKNFLHKNSQFLLIAADGGADFFLQRGLSPDFIIGDLDSLQSEDIKYLQDKGSEIISFPREKDETDAELCLQFCQEKDICETVLFSALGGRIDQQLANIFLLEYALELNIACKILESDLEIGLIPDKKVFFERRGWHLSLLPVDYQVRNVNITGCKYNGEGIKMNRFLTRGISNKITSSRAEVKVGEGKLIYIIRAKGENYGE